MKRWMWVLPVLLAASLVAAQDRSQRAVEWTHYGGDPGGTRHSTLTDVNAGNVKQLRQARGMTQQQVAKIAGLPRATWANLESGAANPRRSCSRTGCNSAAACSASRITSTAPAACVAIAPKPAPDGT